VDIRVAQKSKHLDQFIKRTHKIVQNKLANVIICGQIKFSKKHYDIVGIQYSMRDLNL